MTDETRELAALAERVEAGRTADNALDVLCEVALFVPDDFELAIRPNAAGTKVIVTVNGGERTLRARDWTMPDRRARTVAALRTRALSGTGESR